MAGVRTQNLERLCADNNLKFVDILLDDTGAYQKTHAEIIMKEMNK